MTGANYMGGKRNAAKFRLKDPTKVATRLHFGKQKRLLGLGNLALRVTGTTQENIHSESSQTPSINVGRSCTGNNYLAGAKSIGLKHAKQEMSLTGNNKSNYCFRAASSPTSARVIKRPWVTVLRSEDSDDTSRKRLKVFDDADGKLSYQDKLDRILSIPDFAGISHLRYKCRSSETDSTSRVVFPNRDRHSSDKGTSGKSIPSATRSDHSESTIISSFSSRRCSSDPISEFDFDRFSPRTSSIGDLSSTRACNGTFSVFTDKGLMPSHYLSEFELTPTPYFENSSSHLNNIEHNKENFVPDPGLVSLMQQVLPYSSSSSRIHIVNSSGSVTSDEALKSINSHDSASAGIGGERNHVVTPLPSPRSMSFPYHPPSISMNPSYYDNHPVLSSSQSLILRNDSPYLDSPSKQAPRTVHTDSRTAASALPVSSIPILSDSESLLNSDLLSSPGSEVRYNDEELSVIKPPASQTLIERSISCSSGKSLLIDRDSTIDFPLDLHFRVVKALGLSSLEGHVTSEDAQYPFGRIDANSTVGVGYLPNNGFDRIDVNGANEHELESNNDSLERLEVNIEDYEGVEPNQGSLDSTNDIQDCSNGNTEWRVHTEEETVLDGDSDQSGPAKLKYLPEVSQVTRISDTTVVEETPVAIYSAATYKDSPPSTIHLSTRSRSHLDAPPRRGDIDDVIEVDKCTPKIPGLEERAEQNTQARPTILGAFSQTNGSAQKVGIMPLFQGPSLFDDF